MTQPAFPIQYPNIQGTRHSWGQIEARFNSQLIRGFTGIRYSDSLKPDFVRGTHPQPLDRTIGDYEATCEFEMILAELNAFKFTLSGGGVRGYKQVSFPIVVSYLANGLDTITDEIIGVRIVEEEADAKPSTAGLVRKVTCSVMYIRWNGIFSLDNPLAGSAT